ncbi:MAG: tryptophanyl-tRNA synthetase [Candidatus Saccharibacteria bacterium]|nr:tryptophanyl-tRNA synthetase [Candidatus Saccharibacteria bacterium]
MSNPVILTGLRANNDLTLGNYFGGIKPMTAMATSRASEYQVNMFIPDLHSFTTPVDHTSLYSNVIHNAKLYVAAGLPIDNDSISLYRQSFVPAHSELTWILNCFTGFGEMGRMTQFKDKSATLNQDRISMGLFDYPVLMAADILLYGATYVPVGEDQTQHLEFTRDIAERLNRQFGDLFVVPAPVLKQNEFFGNSYGLRIKDLVDPSKKMSKSDDSGKGVIFLGDHPDEAAKKIQSATTDSLGAVHYDKENQPGISNLLELHALLTNQPLAEVIREYEGTSQYGDFKSTVADAVRNFLIGFQSQLAAIDEVVILQKLEASEARMNQIANETLQRVQVAVGLRK